MGSNSIFFSHSMEHKTPLNFLFVSKVAKFPRANRKREDAIIYLSEVEASNHDSQTHPQIIKTLFSLPDAVHD